MLNREEKIEAIIAASGYDETLYAKLWALSEILDNHDEEEGFIDDTLGMLDTQAVDKTYDNMVSSAKIVE